VRGSVAGHNKMEESDAALLQIYPTKKNSLEAEASKLWF
jgi:hypothetical protein